MSKLSVKIKMKFDYLSSNQMGTHSVIRLRVYDVNTERYKTWFNLYNQWDGYPEVIGKEISKFLNGIKIVNGFMTRTAQRVANGPECLAKQIVGHFYTIENVGSSYLYPGDYDMIEEWNYNVDITEAHEIVLSVFDHKRRVYHGTPEEVLEWCENPNKKTKDDGTLVDDPISNKDDESSNNQSASDLNR